MKRDKHEPERFVMYAAGHREPDVHRRCWIPIFFDPSHARIWLMKFIGSSEYEREGNTVTLPDGFTVRCDRLEEVLNAPEVEWQLPDDYARNCRRFRLGSWEEDHRKPEEEEVETTNEDGETVVVKKKVEKAPKPQKAKKPEGFVTITELCSKWGIKPLHARQALRASDLKKPEYGWAFDPKDEAKLKKICGVK